MLSVHQWERGTHVLGLWSQWASQSWGHAVDFTGRGGTWQTDVFSHLSCGFISAFIYLFSKICLNL